MSDVLLEQNHKVSSLPATKSRDVKTLRKWIKGTASISRDESAYLEHEQDIANLTGATDSALSMIEDTVGDVVFFISRCFREVFQPPPLLNERQPSEIDLLSHLYKSSTKPYDRRTYLYPRSVRVHF